MEKSKSEGCTLSKSAAGGGWGVGGSSDVTDDDIM